MLPCRDILPMLSPAIAPFPISEAAKVTHTIHEGIAFVTRDKQNHEIDFFYR